MSMNSYIDEAMRLVQKQQAIDDRLDTIEKQIKRLFAEISDANKLADKRHKENENMGKVANSFEEQLKKVMDKLGALEDRIMSPGTNDPDPDAMTVRIADIIWQEMSGSKTDARSATSALTRGVRKALNLFYTQRNAPDSDMAIQLASALEIEKAARAEHARISEELVKEKEMHQMHILELNRTRDEVLRLQQGDDGQATTILTLRRELETKSALLTRVGTLVIDLAVAAGVDMTRLDMEEDIVNSMQEMDGPNYNTMSEDLDEA